MNNTGSSRSTSETIVQGTIGCETWAEKISTHVPLFTMHHCQLHRQCFLGNNVVWKYHNWATNQWRRITWSDESRFIIHHVDVGICRYSKEHSPPPTPMSSMLFTGLCLEYYALHTTSWSFLGSLAVTKKTEQAIKAQVFYQYHFKAVASSQIKKNSSSRTTLRITRQH